MGCIMTIHENISRDLTHIKGGLDEMIATVSRMNYEEFKQCKCKDAEPYCESCHKFMDEKYGVTHPK